MKIGDIKRGTKMAIFKKEDNRAVGSAFNAEFRYEESLHTFVVNSIQLYNNYESLPSETQFIIAFEVGPVIYTFSSKLIAKNRSPYLLEMECIGNIRAYNRRKRERDEILVKVNIFDLPPDYLKATDFTEITNNPIISDTTFDMSTGGMCIISNSVLKSKYEPYFLAELLLSSKDVFLIPVKLVRKTTYQRPVIGKYDYGFQFLFEHIPSEESRLMSAIMLKKLT